jgi:hypothetical protein
MKPKNGANMSGILEGKEVEVKLGEVGSISVDVEKTGIVKVEIVAEKEIEGVKAKTSNTVEVSLFVLLEKVAAKTEAKWDDAVVAQLKAILGLVG